VKASSKANAAALQVLDQLRLQCPGVGRPDGA